MWSRLTGVWSLFSLVPWTIGMVEGNELAFPPVRESAGEVSLFILHLFPTGVVVARGRDIQIGFVLISQCAVVIFYQAADGSRCSEQDSIHCDGQFVGWFRNIHREAQGHALGTYAYTYIYTKLLYIN